MFLWKDIKMFSLIMQKYISLAEFMLLTFLFYLYFVCSILFYFLFKSSYLNAMSTNCVVKHENEKLKKFIRSIVRQYKKASK